MRRDQGSAQLQVHVCIGGVGSLICSCFVACSHVYWFTSAFRMQYSELVPVITSVYSDISRYYLPASYWRSCRLRCGRSVTCSVNNHGNQLSTGNLVVRWKSCSKFSCSRSGGNSDSRVTSRGLENLRRKVTFREPSACGRTEQHDPGPLLVNRVFMLRMKTISLHLRHSCSTKVPALLVRKSAFLKLLNRGIWPRYRSNRASCAVVYMAAFLDAINRRAYIHFCTTLYL